MRVVARDRAGSTVSSMQKRHHLTIAVQPEILDRLDAAAREMSKPGAPVSRAATARHLILAGLPRLERDRANEPTTQPPEAA